MKYCFACELKQALMFGCICYSPLALDSVARNYAFRAHKPHMRWQRPEWCFSTAMTPLPRPLHTDLVCVHSLCAAWEQAPVTVTLSCYINLHKVKVRRNTTKATANQHARKFRKGPNLIYAGRSHPCFRRHVPTSAQHRITILHLNALTSVLDCQAQTINRALKITWWELKATD